MRRRRQARGGDGRVVFVTGGSRGIGLACARHFQALGDRVAVTYRSRPAAGWPARPGTVDLLPVPCDVTRRPRRSRRPSRRSRQASGPVEVLVANAGVTKDTLLLRMGEEAGTRSSTPTSSGVYRWCARALGPMVRAHAGPDRARVLRRRLLRARRARSTTAPPRPAWSAWPARWRGRSAAGASPSTSSRPVWSTRI